MRLEKKVINLRAQEAKGEREQTMIQTQSG